MSALVSPREYPHGSHARYTLNRCRCADCREAARVYESKRSRDAVYGRPRLVDARPAAEHVRALMAAGLGWKRVAERAGLGSSTVYPLLYGRPDRRGGAPRTRARRETVEALLGVPFPTLDDFPAGQLVDALGCRRRVQCLVALGWSVRRLAAEAGLDRQVLDGLIGGGRTRVTAGHARVIRDLFDRLQHTPPAQTDAGSKASATRARKWAAAQGWVVPAWWDEEALDDPDAAPSLVPEPSRGVDLDDLLFVIRQGRPVDEALTQTGRSLDVVRQAAIRAGRPDVLAALRTREVAS